MSGESGRRSHRAAPRLARSDLDLAREKAIDVIGKFWAAPNSLFGIGAGLAGHVIGKIQGRDSRISVGNNAVQFEDNPVGGVSAVTLGNTGIYSKPLRDPSMDPNHERQHTYQAQLLGPLYLPSNIAGGLNALVRDGSWHGPHNWNEVGPQMSPPRPWPSSTPR